MEDAEDNFHSSKKRAAGVQLSRDNPGLDNDQETSEQESGTFKRASDDVLAARRIVEVCHPQTPNPSGPATPPASNTFATISLVPPVSAPLMACSVSSKEIEHADQIDSKSEKGDDDPKESTIDAKPCETKVSVSKVFDSEKDECHVLPAECMTKSVVGKVAEGGNSGEGAKKATEDDRSQNETTKDVEVKENKVEKGNGEATTENNEETASFSSFRQLSSSQNAFSGFAGTGFSSNSFSFGSIPKDGPPLGFNLNNDHQAFGFGASNNGNSSTFGTTVANSISNSEDDKFPSMLEVPVETGEENERAIFTSESVLFEYIDGTWKERGKGELKVNVSTAGTGKARLVMRTRGNYRLILNASLFPDMKLTNMDKKGITFACVNNAGDGKGGLSTVALKFKDASIVEDFRAVVLEHKTKTAGALKTPENSP